MASQSEELPPLEDKSYVEEGLIIFLLIMGPILFMYITYVCIYRCFRRKRKAAEQEKRRLKNEQSQPTQTTQRALTTLATEPNIDPEAHVDERDNIQHCNKLTQMYKIGASAVASGKLEKMGSPRSQVKSPDLAQIKQGQDTQTPIHYANPNSSEALRK